MLKKLFETLLGKPKNEVTEKATQYLVATLNDKLGPIYRAEVYERPLDAYLKENNLGEVSGGGTMMQKSTEIDFCNIEIQLNLEGVSKETIAEIIKILEDAGAPKGSELLIEKSGEKIPYGLKEGIAIYLDGTNLPHEVYENCDSNYVMEELKRLTDDQSAAERYWQGSTETALYYYANSFEVMKDSIKDFMESYPLCKNARIKKIA